MKKCFSLLIGIAGLMLMLIVTAAAQDQQYVPENNARANIPFAFYAGPESLPAGRYTFEVDAVNHTVLLKQGATGHEFYLPGVPADPTLNGKALLIFENEAGEYRLKKLRCDSVGVEFVPVQISTLSPYGVR